MLQRTVTSDPKSHGICCDYSCKKQYRRNDWTLQWHALSLKKCFCLQMFT